MNKNIIEQIHRISKSDRQKLNSHKSFILWFTGISGSGKSTLSNHIEEHLYKMNLRTYLLDGDNIRLGLNKDLGFSESDRSENIRRIGEVSKLFIDAGIIVLTAFISPFSKDRELVRKMVKKDEFIEIYVKCSISECEKRDVKGLYKKARAGEIKNFTGINSPYEEPQTPDLILDTEIDSIEMNSKKVIDYLFINKLISTNNSV